MGTVVESPKHKSSSIPYKGKSAGKELEFSEEYLQSKTVDNYYGSDELAKSVIRNKYLHPIDKDNLALLWYREAKSLYDEQIRRYGKSKYTLVEFYEALEDFKYIFGGRIQYSIGVDGILGSLNNCYFHPIEHDSLYGIYHSLGTNALTYAKGGGVGNDITILRPANTAVKGTGATSPGSTSFMDIISCNTGTIAQHGRRGANLISIHCQHPDVEAFIENKNDNFFDYIQKIEKYDKNLARDLNNDFSDRRRTSFSNISIKFTDEFMNAVFSGTDVQLYFPDIDNCPEETDKGLIKKHQQRLVKYYMFYENLSVDEAQEKADSKKPYTIYDTRWDGDLDTWRANGYPIKIHKTVSAADIWDKFCTSAWRSAEPGLLYLDRIKENWGSDKPFRGVNPCLSGDTLVAVADGRNFVSIKTLAEEGTDVPVYTIDDSKKLTVRYMRNPRITGYEKEMVKVTLDDGSVFKVTPDHKFLTHGNGYVEAKDLSQGSSLYLYTKFEASIKDIFPKANANSQDYLWLRGPTSKKAYSDHREIAKFHYNTDIPYGYVVHHKDFDAQNNSPENLQILSKVDHDYLHARNMVGDNNPMRRAKHEWTRDRWEQYSKNMSLAVSGDNNGRYSGITNEELKKHALKLTREMNKRFSTNDWLTYAKRNNLPQHFSSWRKKHLGGIVGFAKWAAVESGVETFVDVDPRVVKTYQELSSQGYDVEILDGHVFVKKECEVCGTNFSTHHAFREHGICSKECNTTKLNKDPLILKKRTESIYKNSERKKAGYREAQVAAYLDLKQVSINGIVLKVEWEKECKRRGVPFRLGDSSNFKTFADVQQQASFYNHRVVSVEICEKETVYNGTVDGFHNFFIVGKETTSGTGKKSWPLINNLQCGEILLSEYEPCCLGHVNLARFVDLTTKRIDSDRLKKYIPIFIYMQDLIHDVNEGRQALRNQEKESLNYRRIGSGYTALGDALIMMDMKYDDPATIEYMESVVQEIEVLKWQASADIAVEKGAYPKFDYTVFSRSEHFKKMPENLRKQIKDTGIRNVATSTIAPVGTGSILTQTSSGIEPIFATHYKRRVKQEDGSYQTFYTYPKIVQEKFGSHKNLPDYVVTAHSVSYKDRVKMQGAFQRWIDNSISSTVNLSKDSTVQDVKDVYEQAFKSGLKGVSVYRDGSRAGVLITDDSDSNLQEGHAPKSPDRLPAIRVIRKFEGRKFYFTVTMNNGSPYEVFLSTNAHTSATNCDIAVEALEKLLRRHKIAQNLIDEQIEKSKHQANSVKVCRLVSMAMRHGIDLFKIVKTLVDLDMPVSTFIYHLGKVLSEWVPNGTPYDKESGWIFQNGCVINVVTGESKC